LHVFINDKYHVEEEAKISVFDQGVLFGDGVYDTLVVQNGYIFKLDNHVDRFYRSAKSVMIDVPYKKEEFKKKVIETVKRNGLKNAYLKFIITRGKGPRPILGKGDIVTPTVIIFAVPPVYVVSPEKIKKGAKAISSLLKRSHHISIDPRVKSLNYQSSALMRIEARKLGADEGIGYDYEGYVTEGSAENIFVIKNRSLITPVSGILKGITRETVMEIACEKGYNVLETNLTRYDLYTADEVLMCSTAGGIFPIIEIDGRKIGNGKPGPITKKLIKEYNIILSKGVHGTPV
jgi:branched-chain amino acid aminotransferase